MVPQVLGRPGPALGFFAGPSHLIEVTNGSRRRARPTRSIWFRLATKHKTNYEETSA
jgi:hypothetical protein